MKFFSPSHRINTTLVLLLLAFFHSLFLSGQTPFDSEGLKLSLEKAFFKPMVELDWPRIEKQASKLRKYRGPVQVNSGDYPGEFGKGFLTGALTGTEVKKPKVYLYMLTPRVQLIDEVAKRIKLAESIDIEALTQKYSKANTFYLAADATGRKEAFLDDLLGMRAIREKTPVERIYLKTPNGIVQSVKMDGDRFYFPLDVIPDNRWHRVYAVIVDQEGSLIELDISGQVMINNHME